MIQSQLAKGKLAKGKVDSVYINNAIRYTKLAMGYIVCRLLANTIKFLQ